AAISRDAAVRLAAAFAPVARGATEGTAIWGAGRRPETEPGSRWGAVAIAVAAAAVATGSGGAPARVISPTETASAGGAANVKAPCATRPPARANSATGAGADRCAEIWLSAR